MKEASVVPDTAPSIGRRPRAAPAPVLRRPSWGADEQERELVRNMLSYLASSLPRPAGPEARLLALQCALRSGTSGHAHIPAGLTRGMALGCPADAWSELEAAGWLWPPSDDAQDRTVRLTDPISALPGSRTRSRAADWALRAARGRELSGMSASSRMVALTLRAHTQPHTRSGMTDAHNVGRMCTASVPLLLDELRGLAERRIVAAWALDPCTEDLTWQLPDSASL